MKPAMTKWSAVGIACALSAALAPGCAHDSQQTNDTTSAPGSTGGGSTPIDTASGGSGGSAQGGGGTFGSAQGGGDTGGAAQGGSDTGGSAQTGGGTGAGCAAPMDACGGPDQCAPGVATQWVAENAPEPHGGQLKDGTYWLIAATDYTGPGGFKGPTGSINAMTMVVAGNELLISVTHPKDNPPTTVSTNATFTTQDAALIIDASCPESPPNQVTFTASGDSFHIFYPLLNLTSELVLQRQP